MKNYFNDLNINPQGLSADEMAIINDWYAHYSKFDRNVHLFDAKEIKIYVEQLRFLKKEYENVSFYDDFWFFAADEDSNCAAIATKGAMRGWIFFFSEEMSAKPVFRNLKNFYDKVKSEEITDVSPYWLQPFDFRNKTRTPTELSTDNTVFDEILQKIHRAENKHDRSLLVETLIAIAPPDRLHDLTSFLSDTDHFSSREILEAFAFYNYQADNALLYDFGKKNPEFRKQLKQMSIRPRGKFLWWDKW